MCNLQFFEQQISVEKYNFSECQFTYISLLINYTSCYASMKISLH